MAILTGCISLLLPDLLPPDAINLHILIAIAFGVSIANFHTESRSSFERSMNRGKSRAGTLTSPEFSDERDIFDKAVLSSK